VILSGALGPMVPVASGDHIHAQIGALGSVGCRIT
jgi:2-keto-4-pentenoate hydratase